jgi:YVTN family beta-propeller protein
MHWQVSVEGVAVEATLEALDETAEGSPFQEGRPVRVSFRVTDEATGEAYAGLYPAAWMDRVPERGHAKEGTCQDKAETFLGGSLLSEPEVNLNVYYVLALNDDATITVVDPLFGFGGTKLLALIQLESPGEDWALSADGRTLYVSMPEVDRVAVVDTATWKVTATVDVGGRPGELALQPDGRYLWVATSEPREGFGGPGVTVIDTQGPAKAAHLPTGPGPQHLAISGDGRWALVASGADGRLTVVDTGSLSVVSDAGLGGRASGIAWSEAAGVAYVTVFEGSIVVVDPARPAAAGPVRSRIAAEPGLGRIAFAPDGRLGFVVNPSQDLVHIVDAARGRIIQTADVEGAPDQVAFSDELAYIRHAGSGTVLMIPLDTVGQEGAPVPVVDFPGGQRAPSESGLPAAADAIVQAPGASAVLVANPSDGVIYYYKEGMAAPMGSFRNYGREPRAVQVVDRSLRERGRGGYETVVQLRRPGEYDLVFYLDTPTTIRCFPFTVAQNPEILRAERAHRVDLSLVDADVRLVPGQPVTVGLQARDPETGVLRGDLDDLRALVFLAPGIWQRREAVARLGEGRYALTFTPPEEGLYYLFFQSAEVGMTFQRSPSFVLEAMEVTAAK